MSSYFEKPQHWRMRAEMTRTIAAGMCGDQRTTLLRIAEQYETVAQQVEDEAAAIAARAMAAATDHKSGLQDRIVELQKKWGRK